MRGLNDYVVHGGPGADFGSLLPLQALSDEYFVVFYDQRGTGLSARVPPEELTVDRYLQDLNFVVDAIVGLDHRAHLIGHSFGGMLVSAYLAEYPDKVDKVVLAEPGPLTPEAFKNGPNIGFDPTDPDQRQSFFRAVLDYVRAVPVDADAKKDTFIMRMMLEANPEYWCDSVPPEQAVHFRFGYDANSYVTSDYVDLDGGHMTRDFLDGVDQMRSILFLASECNTIIGADFQWEQAQYFTEPRVVISA